jgi:hypothetical protein
MSKGIVKKTPAITKRQHPGRLLVKEIEGPGNQALLETEIDFYTPDFFIKTDDYVEFALNLAGWAHLTRSVYCRGRIIDLINAQTGVPGTLEVTIANPNSGLQNRSIISYHNNFAIPLVAGDYVEFSNISLDKTSCEVVRKIECVGAVVSVPGANPGSMTIRSVGSNLLGIEVGSSNSISLAYIGTAPFHVGDLIEYRVIDNARNARFVQIVSRA